MALGLGVAASGIRKEDGFECRPGAVQGFSTPSNVAILVSERERQAHRTKLHCIIPLRTALYRTALRGTLGGLRFLMGEVPLYVNCVEEKGSPYVKAFQD